MVLRLPDSWSNWNLEMFWFLRRGENRSKGQNQQQTQPTYGVDAKIRTRSTLARGECSHHSATLAPNSTVEERWANQVLNLIYSNEQGTTTTVWRNSLKKMYCDYLFHTVFCGFLYFSCRGIQSLHNRILVSTYIFFLTHRSRTIDAKLIKFNVPCTRHWKSCPLLA